MSPRVRWPVAVVMAVALALQAAACTASAREKAISATMASVDGARVAFVTFDEQHQMALVSAAPDKPTLDKQLADYKTKRGDVEAAFAVAYRGIAAAAQVNTDQSFASMTSAAADLVQALQALGVKLP